MADTFSEVTNTGWFGRIGNSIKGILIGGIMFAAAIVVLFWNEGRAVHRAKDLSEAKTACVSVDPAKVDPARDNKLVHVSADAQTDETLVDNIFGVSDKAIALQRIVEMHQWKEKKETKTRKKLGGGEERTTTYNYTKTWDDDVIDSSDFKHPEDHINPASKAFTNLTLTAKKVSLGAFALAPALIHDITNFERLDIPADAPLPASVKEKAKPHDGGYYVGANSSEPQIGDCRIHFQAVHPGPVTVVARQSGDTLTTGATKYNAAFKIVHIGNETMEQVFKVENDKNTMLTWLLRLLGFIVMWIGLYSIMAPLKVFADVVPFIGSIVGAGLAIIALLIAGTISIITIAVAWIVYRPLLGICLLALAAGAIVLIKRRLSRASATMQNASLPPVPTSALPPIPRTG